MPWSGRAIAPDGNDYPPRRSSDISVCGRFAIGEIRDLVPRFSIDSPIADMPRPRYNIAPTQDAPIVIDHRHRQLLMMRFGLIPFWSKDARIGVRLINARVETAKEKPVFRSCLEDRRCLVPTTGFYEWGPSARGREPYFVRLKSEKLFAMAGLYDHWMDPRGDLVHSFTILTTSANDLMAPIHDRMPVILNIEDEKEWAAPVPLGDGELERIGKPFPSERMELYRVSREVNDLSKDSDELISPAGEVRQRTLF